MGVTLDMVKATRQTLALAALIAFCGVYFVIGVGLCLKVNPIIGVVWLIWGMFFIMAIADRVIEPVMRWGEL